MASEGARYCLEKRFRRNMEPSTEFLMCSIVKPRFPFKTSETMLGVPNTSTKSFCFRLFASISSFNISMGLAGLRAYALSSKSSISATLGLAAKKSAGFV